MKDFTVKYALKNFLSCLKYIFVPLGLLSLGVILGLSLAIPICGQSLNKLFEVAANSMQDATIDTAALRTEFFAVVGELNWKEPLTAINSLMDKAWFTAAITRCLTAMTGTDYTANAGVLSEIDDTVNGVITGFAIILVFVIFAFIGGYMLTKSLIRKELASRSVWKFILVYVVHGLATLGITALGVWFVALWKYSVFIFPVVFFLLMSILSMFEAYLVHGWHKVPAKKILTSKNIRTKIISDFIIFLVWVAIVAIITLIFKKFAGMLIGVLMFEIATIVIDMNAEAYVKDFVEKKL